MRTDKYGPNKEMKNGWLTFYTKIKPWFCIVLGIIWGIGYINYEQLIVTAGIINNILCLFGIEPINWINAGSEYWANVTVMVIRILWNALMFVIPAILCLVFSGINYKKYVNIIKFSLFADIFVVAYISTIEVMEMLWKYSHYGIGWFIFVFVIGYPTWYKMNVKYFEARRLDPEAEERVMKESFFKKVDGINKRKAKEEEDEYGFRKR